VGGQKGGKKIGHSINRCKNTRKIEHVKKFIRCLCRSHIYVGKKKGEKKKTQSASADRMSVWGKKGGDEEKNSGKTTIIARMQLRWGVSRKNFATCAERISVRVEKEKVGENTIIRSLNSFAILRVSLGERKKERKKTHKQRENDNNSQIRE